MSCVIYRMTVIYNLNTSTVAKIIFKIEIETENKNDNNSCPLVHLSAHLFPLLWAAWSDWSPPPVTSWTSGKHISALTRWAGRVCVREQVWAMGWIIILLAHSQIKIFTDSCVRDNNLGPPGGLKAAERRLNYVISRKIWSIWEYF